MFAVLALLAAAAFLQPPPATTSRSTEFLVTNPFEVESARVLPTDIAWLRDDVHLWMDDLKRDAKAEHANWNPSDVGVSNDGHAVFALNPTALYVSGAFQYYGDKPRTMMIWTAEGDH